MADTKTGTKMSISIPAAMRELLDEVQGLIGPLAAPMNATIKTRTSVPGKDGMEEAKFEAHYPMGVHVSGIVRFWTSHYGEHRRVTTLTVRSTREHCKTLYEKTRGSDTHACSLKGDDNEKARFTITYVRG